MKQIKYRRLLVAIILVVSTAIIGTVLALTFKGVLARINLKVLAANCTVSPVNASVVMYSGGIAKLHLVSNVTVRNVGKLGMLMYLVPTSLPQGSVLALANITVVGPDGKIVWSGCLAQTTSKYTVYSGYFCKPKITYTSGGEVNISVEKISIGKSYRYPIIVHEGTYHVIINVLIVTGYVQNVQNMSYKITTILETPKLVTNIS